MKLYLTIIGIAMTVIAAFNIVFEKCDKRMLCKKILIN